MKFDCVVHHAKCADGDCAAWVVAHYHKTNVLPVPSTVPCAASQTHTLDITQFKDKSVIFVDICPDRDTIVRIADIATYVKVIDHHKTNYEALEGLNHPKVQCIFDMTQSGCQLTWQAFFSEPEPWFLQIIGNRDMWNFSVEHTLEYFLGMDEKNLLNYDGFSIMAIGGDGLKREILDAGLRVKEFQDRNLQVFTKLRTECTYKNARVWLVNCPVKELISELGNALMKIKFDDGCSPDFAVIWNYNISTDNYSLSMRSMDTKWDVSAVCKEFGGGGHRNAAGCTCIRIQDVFEPVLSAGAQADIKKRMLGNMYRYLVDDIYMYILNNGVEALENLSPESQYAGFNMIFSTAFRDRVAMNLYDDDEDQAYQLFHKCAREALARINRENVYSVKSNFNSKYNSYSLIFFRK